MRAPAADVDVMPVTAVAARPGVGGRVRATPSARAGAGGVRRVTGSWQEPNTWTVGILLATGVLVLARHPLAHALGTEVDPPAPVAATTAPVVRAAPAAPALALPVAPVPTHAPRDPFRALVVAGAAAVMAPAPAATADCVATHVVHPGESLWAVAGRATGSSDTERLTLAWHRLYDANRARVGADPSRLAVGTPLCVPRSL